MTTRRAFLACTAALALTPRGGRAQAVDALRTEAAALEQIWSLTVARNGETVFAKRFRGPPLDRAVNVKSVSKTVVATLAGAAIDRGAIAGTGATLGQIAPRLIPDQADPRVAGITVADLLTLRAGLERTSGANYGAWVSSRDWVAYALSREMVAQPGTRFLYSTGTTHVLGAALSEATGESLLTLARAWIGAPLDIRIEPWLRDPQGRYFGGNDMALTPDALIRLGEAYRTGGGGVVSAGWIDEAWTPRTRSPFSRDDYGYGWFLREAAGLRVAYGRGYGGQMLWVVPEAGITAVAISDPTLPARSEGHVGDLQRLLADRILPAFA
jgi:CubicO group peptidase (beta-lactamase class C family)